jgi:ABC-type arginine/histidine transport system permease subunit
MIRIAQILSGLFVLVLGSAALVTMLFPAVINEPSGFNAATNYGFTNLRTLGAPTLSLAVITAIGAYKKEWLLLLPASLYFCFNFSARVISTFIEGYEPTMLFGLIMTFTLFVLSQIALHGFRANRQK